MPSDESKPDGPIGRITGSLGRVQVNLTVRPPVAEAAAVKSEDDGAWTLNWQTVLGIVGAAAALGLWINIVGGAVLWARFQSADLPTSEVVGIVPNSTLLGIGVQAL